jgi:hypothetical protein
MKKNEDINFELINITDFFLKDKLIQKKRCYCKRH